jgi:two-component SAPR family response regulator
MDGAEFRRQQLLIPAAAAIPFIRISGADRAARVARDLRMADVIPKPFDAERLLRVVASHCHRAH